MLTIKEINKIYEICKIRDDNHKAKEEVKNFMPSNELVSSFCSSFIIKTLTESKQSKTY